MLKKRIIGCVLVKHGIAVQSIGFRKYLPIGSPVILAEYLNKWGVDEIVYLDIDATTEGREPNYELVESVAKECFIPLSVGGGIKNINDIQRLTKTGADKIIINSELFNNPELLEKAAATFGSQCIVASIDLLIKDGKSEIRSHSGTIHIDTSVHEWVIKLEQLGAGEIFVNCIHKDGMKNGYDIKLLDEISRMVNIPVVGCGGAGNPRHIWEVLEFTELSGAAVGNYFNYLEHSPVIVKSFLKNKNIDTRIDTEFDYVEHTYDEAGKINKKNDSLLYELIFTYHEPEVI